MKAVIIVATAILFSKPAKAANLNNGLKLYQKCIECHGQNGEGDKSQKAPRIGGQYSWYIISQLNAFKSGERKNPVMLPLSLIHI